MNSKRKVTMGILSNGIFDSRQEFTSEKDMKAAVKVMREQLGCKVELTKVVKGHFYANMITFE